MNYDKEKMQPNDSQFKTIGNKLDKIFDYKIT